MAHAGPAPGLRLAVLAVGGAALAWAITAIVAVDAGAERPTSHAAALPAARVTDLAAGFGLIVVGALDARANRLQAEIPCA